MLNALLGEGHQRIVDVLVERLGRIRANEPVARVVLLRGASGVGKSRIIQEVYDRLRAEQPTKADGEGYWPALVEADLKQVPGRERMPVRKVLGPPVDGFDRPPGTLPSFPVVAGRLRPDAGRHDAGRGGFAGPAVAGSLPVLGAGVPGRCGYRSTVPGLDQGSGAQGGRTDRQGGRAVGIALPGAGYALTTSVRAGREFRRRRDVARQVREGGGLQDEGPNAAEMLFEQVTRLLHPQLPLILVVEDLHLMGPALADFLDYLAQPLADKPVLVIGTVWPEAEHRDTYSGWLQKGSDGTQALVETVDVPALPTEDLVELARRYAPYSELEVLQQVAERWTNPYALILLMTDQRVRRAHLRDGALEITAAELNRLPTTIRGLYERRWAELPESVQSALMLAAGCLPRGGTGGQLWPFIRTIVAEAARITGLLDDPDEVVRALGEAVDPYEWARTQDRDLDLDLFREWVLVSIARDLCDDQYGDVDLGAAVAQSLSAWFEERADQQEDYFLDLTDSLLDPATRWLLALAPDAKTTLGVGIAALTLARILADVYEYRAAIDLMTPDRVRALGEDHPDTLATRGTIALWTGEVGDVVGALELFEGLLADRVRVLGEDHPDTVRNRHDIAIWTGEVGDVAGALELSRGVLADQVRVLGKDAPDTLTTRGNIAHLTGEVGDVAGALELFQGVLADQVRVLGEDHPDTLVTRGSIASWTGEMGDVAGALELFQSLLTDQVRVLGGDAPDTLATQRWVAYLRRRIGEQED